MAQRSDGFLSDTIEIINDPKVNESDQAHSGQCSYNRSKGTLLFVV